MDESLDKINVSAMLKSGPPSKPKGKETPIKASLRTSTLAKRSKHVSSIIHVGQSAALAD